MSPAAAAALVFVFMAVLAAHAFGGVLHALIPPGTSTAIRGIDALIHGALVGTIGRLPATGLLSALAVLFAYIAFRRAAREQAGTADTRQPDALPRQQPLTPARSAGAAAAPSPPAAPLQPVAVALASLPSLAEAAEHCLAFRHVFPPRLPMTSRTFFGGTPVAPADFEWPRLTDKAGKSEPLDFMGQLDCSTIPDGPGRALLPATGVLYFFAGLSSSLRDAKSSAVVRYVPAPPSPAWREAPLPRDLPPAHGAGNAFYHYPYLHGRDLSEYPRTFPKVEMETGWIPTFAAAAREADESGDDAKIKAWRAQHAPALIAFHGGIWTDDPLLSPYHKRGDQVWLPFEGFPSTWMAIDMIARSLRHHLVRQRERLSKKQDAALEAERLPVYDRVDAEAQDWIDRAALGDALDEPAAAHKTEFVSWLSALHGERALGDIVRSQSSLALDLTRWLSQAATLSSEAMLRDENARSRVPDAVVRALQNRHKVVREHMIRDGTYYQHQMFGRGRVIQYIADDMAHTHYMLLQLGPDDGLDWDMGDAGAFQYWITPEDLAARRFENVVLTFECH